MTIPTRAEALQACAWLRERHSLNSDPTPLFIDTLRSYIESHTGEPVAWANPQEMRLWKTGKNRTVTLRQWQDGYCTDPLYASPVQPDPITAHQVIEFMERETGLPFGDFIGITDKERIKAMAASIGDK